MLYDLSGCYMRIMHAVIKVFVITLLSICVSVAASAQRKYDKTSLPDLVREIQLNSQRMHDSIQSAQYHGYSKFHIYVGWNALGLNFLPVTEEYHFNGFWTQPDSNRIEIVAMRKATPDTNASVQVKVEAGFPMPNPFQFSYDMSALGTDDEGDNRHPATFYRSHIKEPVKLARKLRDSDDRVSGFVRGNFTEETIEILEGYGNFTQPMDSLKRAMRRTLGRTIAKEFNTLISGDIIYTAERFQNVKLSKETKKLLKLEPSEVDTLALNRMLLENTYSKEIRKFDRDGNPEIIRWPVFPFAVGADSIYNYELLSEIGFDIRRVIEIGVRPKDTNDPGVIGKFQIDPDEKIVVGSDVVFNEAAHYLQQELDAEDDMWYLRPFMSVDEDHRTRTRKALVFSTYWLPEVVEEEFFAKIWGIKVKIAREIHYTSYDINPVEPPDTTVIADKRVSYDIDPEFDQEIFKDWVEPAKLNKDFEAKVIKNIEQSFAELELDEDLFDSKSIFKDAMKKKIGDRGNRYYSFAQRLLDNVMYNRVEGLRIDYGIAFADVLTTRNAVSFKGGYGFDDREWKGGAAFVQYLDKKEKFFVEANGYKTLAFDDDMRRFSHIKNTITSLFINEDNRDYYYKTGLSIGLGFKPAGSIAFKLSGISHTEEGAVNNTKFSLVRWERPFRLNPGIIEGEYRGIRSEIMYRSGLLNATLTADHTDKENLHSDFSFTTVKADIDLSYKIDRVNSIYLNLSGAVSDGDLPPQRWFDFGGKSFLNYKGCLRGVHYKAFTGDRMAYGVFEYQRYFKDLFDFEGVGSRFDGLKRMLKLHLWAGAGWSELSDSNRLYASGVLTPDRITDDVYHEFGIGIGDRFNAFRLDFIRNSLDDNGIRVSFNILR